MYSHVSKITQIYNANEGCTCPALAQLDNVNKVVLKYPKNPMGIIVLFNEYITYRIAKEIQVTVPNFGLAHIDNNTKIDECFKKFFDIDDICFFSEFIAKSVKVSKRTLRYAKNLNEAPRIILLDHIVKNTDRYSANMLISVNKNDANMYAIDHSHALGDPEWNTATLSKKDIASPEIWENNADFYNMLIDAGAEVTEDSMKSECDAIKEILTDVRIDNIFLSIPQCWKSQIGEQNIKCALEYIKNRVTNLHKICDVINQERSV